MITAPIPQITVYFVIFFLFLIPKPVTALIIIIANTKPAGPSSALYPSINPWKKAPP